MERNECGGRVGDQDTAFGHVDIYLSGLQIGREVGCRFVGFVFVEFLDFFLLVGEFDQPALGFNL